ncbi:MAG: hypothetical protein ABIN57_05585 [Chitinophagaceae bacterium]
MKKYILIMSAALLTGAAVTATVLSTGKPKRSNKEVTCPKKGHCPKMNRTHCFDL